MNKRNSDFFSRQATAKRFSLLIFLYIVGLAHQFWLDLDRSLTFSNELYLKNIIRFFATINQRKSDFFPSHATAKPFSLLSLIDIVGPGHQFWSDLDNSLTF